jgi:hypothetical protein
LDSAGLTVVGRVLGRVVGMAEERGLAVVVPPEWVPAFFLPSAFGRWEAAVSGEGEAAVGAEGVVEVGVGCLASEKAEGRIGVRVRQLSW